MKQTKPSLDINLDLLQEDELRYFFRPFFWKEMDYNILWDEKISPPNSSVVDINVVHEEIIDVVATHEPRKKETIMVENLEDIEKQQQKNTSLSANDILASYNDIVKRY